LTAAKPVLMDLQEGKCFYCDETVKLDSGHVDHFIPWSNYSTDLAHNFVLADGRCNSKKRDRIPHVDHLAKWCVRNQKPGDQITLKLKEKITCDLLSTNRIAFWAYHQTEVVHGLTWLRGDELTTLASGWQNYLRQT
jgi:hypothetical protein